MDQAALLRKHFGTDDLDEYKAIHWADGEVEEGPPEAWARLRLPYEAPDDSLPPIPTAEDVKEAGELECNRKVKEEGLLLGVYRVNSVYAVKFGESNAILQVT